MWVLVSRFLEGRSERIDHGYFESGQINIRLCGRHNDGFVNLETLKKENLFFFLLRFVAIVKNDIFRIRTPSHMCNYL